eukprot:gnl/MRDRNA2_/MRDRNA2_36377_c0_seq1.p1 gnl/MRDRNA2_/MRDRNA2_36377_c0~~gnl/MRDRNA2_/MRDRNA2_36377_c0_seq1.p1  ORF type:complete len:461 (+),score=92.71 gnl/MRDRNA2_/MRDRNA2_36377_c0_seq1:180-1385(+)
MPPAKKKVPSDHEFSPEAKGIRALFRSLDATLVQYSIRQKRAFYEDLRVEVETAARCTFTLDRVSHILALAKGGLMVSWVQISKSVMPSSMGPFKLEFKQIIQGESRVPSPSELRNREVEFANTLFEVMQKGQEMPSVALPQVPSATEAKIVSQSFRPAEDLKRKFAEMWGKGDTEGTNKGLTRLQALRERARGREVIWNAISAEQTARNDYTKAVSSHENAEVVLNVLVSLFSSRQQVKEKEVLTILTSTTRKPMSDEEACVALKELLACGEDFVQRVESEYEGGLFYLRSIPSGYPRHVSERLRSKKAELEKSYESEVNKIHTLSQKTDEVRRTSEEATMCEVTDLSAPNTPTCQQGASNFTPDLVSERCDERLADEIARVEKHPRLRLRSKGPIRYSH